MPDEKMFMQEGGVTVTSTRFITPAKTHAMAGITAVSAQEKKIDASWSITLMIVGAILTFSNWGGSSTFGIILLLVGLLWLAILFFNKTYVVRAESASGHSDALESKNKDFILSVVAALGEAIVYRG